jgi:toxin ParE1/3/4
MSSDLPHNGRSPFGRGSRGYVALYRYVPEVDTVFLLAIRSQREAGYAREL